MSVARGLFMQVSPCSSIVYPSTAKQVTVGMDVPVFGANLTYRVAAPMAGTAVMVATS